LLDRLREVLSNLPGVFLIAMLVSLPNIGIFPSLRTIPASQGGYNPLIRFRERCESIPRRRKKCRRRGYLPPCGSMAFPPMMQFRHLRAERALRSHRLRCSQPHPALNLLGMLHTAKRRLRRIPQPLLSYGQPAGAQTITPLGHQPGARKMAS
jgi:hypothetical protein